MHIGSMSNMVSVGFSYIHAGYFLDTTNFKINIKKIGYRVAWGYLAATPLGNIIFFKVDIIL